jgi:hypothetical protein
MDAVAESNMGVGITSNIEPVGIRKLPLVTVRGADDRQHHRARRNELKHRRIKRGFPSLTDSGIL